MDADLISRYDGRVPRYTSYPTAPHFHDGITAATYAEWLGQLGAGDELSLYFHVPFCTRMCWYCGCHTKVVQQYKPVEDYVALLLAELDLVGAAMEAGGGGRAQVAQIHWGGGSPTILSAEDMERLMGTVRERFSLAEDAEIAIEIDVTTLTEDKVKTLAAAGVNRASLGIQDFNQQVQEAINRVQSFEVTTQAVTWLRVAGIDALNFDLMYGLPHQTEADCRRTVDLCMALRPDRLAIFGYAHVPWMKTHQKMIAEDALAGAEGRFAQAQATAEQLVSHGFRRIGLDHFAHADDAMTKALDEGRLHRNFQGYTTDRGQVLIGFGASSIGTLPQGYVQNEVPFGRYREAIQGGRLATARGIVLTEDDRLRRRVIEELMCSLTVDLDAVLASFGIPQDGFTRELAELAPMRVDGLVESDGHVLRITEKGRPFMRTICAVFDRYLASGKGRHSSAV